MPQLHSTFHPPKTHCPDDALVFRHGDAYVPVVRNNRIHLARATLGNDDGREVEIASGLSASDLIAVNVGEASKIETRYKLWFSLASTRSCR
jgi:hypothetical protein